MKEREATPAQVKAFEARIARAVRAKPIKKVKPIKKENQDD